jgi:hypothetical protein
MVELYLQSPPICLHGIVLKYIVKYRDNFIFTPKRFAQFFKFNYKRQSSVRTSYPAFAKYIIIPYVLGTHQDRVLQVGLICVYVQVHFAQEQCGLLAVSTYNAFKLNVYKLLSV